MPNRNATPSMPVPESSSGGNYPPNKPPTGTTHAGSDDYYDKLHRAIEAFEEILKAMPSDRSALETLHMAYRQVGDTGKSQENLIRYAEVLVQEKDLPALEGVLGELKHVAQSDQRAAKVLKRALSLGLEP